MTTTSDNIPPPPQAAGDQVSHAAKPQAVRFHQLDGLRAIAALLVLVHHSGSRRTMEVLTSHGWPRVGRTIFETTQSGVELFFCLSGVLLLRPYLRTNRKLDWSNYAKRRALRLWPPFVFAWLISGLVVAVINSHPTWWTRQYRQYPFSFSNWLAQLGIINLGWPRYNEAWWSLTVEVIFYAIVPVIILIMARSMMRMSIYLAAFVLTVVASYLTFRAGLVGESPQRVLMLISLYSPCFLAGIFLAKYDLSEWIANALIIGGLVLSGVSIAFDSLPIQIGLAFFYGGVIASLIKHPSPASSALAFRPLVWVGERSYSLFLTHFAAFNLVNYLCSLVFHSASGKYMLTSRVLGYVLAFGVMVFCFQFFERPFARNLETANEFWPTRTKKRA